MQLHKIWPFLGLLFFCHESRAEYYGRFISGGFLSKEVFRNQTSDRYNDVSVLSQRLFVNFDEVVSEKNELTVDIRDKHDFFEKLDAQRLQLTGSNHLQLNRLQLHRDQVRGMNYSFGRFMFPEGGGARVDGLDLGFNNKGGHSRTKYSLFYGLNPEGDDYELQEPNKDKTIRGAYFLYENKGSDWKNYFYTSNAYVQKLYKNIIDRSYFFNNTVLQSANGHFFSSLIYLDFVPKTYVQNIWLNHYTILSNQYRISTSASSIDSIYYSRQKDVREQLPSSRYDQGSMAIRSPTRYSETSYETKVSGGRRQVDNKSRYELKLTSFIPNMFGEDMGGRVNLGGRQNFVSKDGFGGFEIFRTKKAYEMSFGQNFAYEKNDDQTNNFVSITDVSYTRFFSRSLFGIFSAQNIYDKNVSIFSVLFKLTYRFGSGGSAPIRDGSSPMGQL